MLTLNQPGTIGYNFGAILLKRTAQKKRRVNLENLRNFRYKVGLSAQEQFVGK